MTHKLNRLTSSPLGSYTYVDSAHLHAATELRGGGGPQHGVRCEPDEIEMAHFVFGP